MLSVGTDVVFKQVCCNIWQKLWGEKSCQNPFLHIVRHAKGEHLAISGGTFFVASLTEDIVYTIVQCTYIFSLSKFHWTSTWFGFRSGYWFGSGLKKDGSRFDFFFLGGGSGSGYHFPRSRSGQSKAGSINLQYIVWNK